MQTTVMDSIESKQFAVILEHLILIKLKSYKIDINAHFKIVKKYEIAWLFYDIHLYASVSVLKKEKNGLDCSTSL